MTIKLTRQEINHLSHAAHNMVMSYREALKTCGENHIHYDILERFMENHDNLEQKLNSLLESSFAQEFELHGCDKKA